MVDQHAPSQEGIVSRTSPSSPAAVNQIGPMMERAVELHQAGRTVDAALIYRAIILQHPKHFDATHLLGVVAMQENRLDEAKTLITAALQIRPNDAPALSNLGTVHLREKQPERARALFERSAKLQPNSGSAQTNLGTALRQLGRYREALVPLRIAYAGNPGFRTGLQFAWSLSTGLGRHAGGRATVRSRHGGRA